MADQAATWTDGDDDTDADTAALLRGAPRAPAEPTPPAPTVPALCSSTLHECFSCRTFAQGRASVCAQSTLVALAYAVISALAYTGLVLGVYAMDALHQHPASQAREPVSPVLAPLLFLVAFAVAIAALVTFCALVVLFVVGALMALGALAATCVGVVTMPPCTFPAARPRPPVANDAQEPPARTEAAP